MSEAIIARRIKEIQETIYNTIYNDIYVDIEVPIFNPPKYDFITTTSLYTVPSTLSGNSISVELYGAKGSDSSTGIGFPGEVITEEISVSPGETVPVYIGKAGTDGSNGEPSSFGNYIIANGGLSASNISSLSKLGNSGNYNNGEGYAIIRYSTSDDIVEENVKGVE